MDQIRNVPFLDLQSQIGPIRSEILEAIESAIDTSAFVLGMPLTEFETAFAGYCECEAAVGVNSGTDALFLALKALDIGAGHEVITAPNMFVAAVEAIIHTGARPVLVDVREDTYCIDPEAVQRAISARTRAVIPVHLFGLPCDMDSINDIARRHDLHVIEDACQAHGARYQGRPVGSLGDAAAFSFYPTKNLGGFGDGGMVTTNNTQLAARIRSLRHHAQAKKNEHAEPGYNSRLDCIQAAVLNVRLRHLDSSNEIREALASRYRSNLQGSDYSFQTVPTGSKHVYHVFSVRHARRKLVHEELNRSGIGWGNHIAMPIHMQPGYRHLGYGRGEFPVAETLCEELVSVPIYPSLSVDDVDYVCDSLARVVVPV